MRDTLSRVVGVVPGQVHSAGRDGEALHDACRAYGLLLHSSKLKEAPLHQEASSQVQCSVCLNVYHTIYVPPKPCFRVALNTILNPD